MLFNLVFANPAQQSKVLMKTRRYQKTRSMDDLENTRGISEIKTRQ